MLSKLMTRVVGRSLRASGLRAMSYSRRQADNALVSEDDHLAKADSRYGDI